MSKIKVDYGGELLVTTGAAKSNILKIALNGVTDANPLIIYGNFTGANLYYYGIYSDGSSYTNSQLKTNINLGETQHLDCGTNPNNTFHAWRSVTVYANRIEIGSCSYGQVYGQYTNTDGTLGQLGFLAAS